MIEKFLPHRHPVRLVDEIISHDENGIVCNVNWPQKTFFHKNPRTAMVEMIAQTAAVMMAKLGGDAQGLGMLTAIKNFEFFADPQQMDICVEVNIEGELGQHKIVNGIVKQCEIVLVKGRVFLYLDRGEINE
ncbi:hypothetical protein [Candidatus Uabimicrobium amorphum]|uniref:Uncharacterized protein n=1 Tax=Uabimicrobium amorphum TaxID=2596890 RepID=A0A5S9IP83_UABAM|nr:hypothetical protein [Candidatus Uabimicrobium amorphum]BBM85157.1 hypothetical protein UABAM_03520 [Candidatus Uabimicrobium amorphum]